jgi:hypothetical protein
MTIQEEIISINNKINLLCEDPHRVLYREIDKIRSNKRKTKDQQLQEIDEMKREKITKKKIIK